ncbi:glycosyltransferase family 39 protein [Tardiphaga alba]|uniref:glycosyltransferase family 39 protein n=1 Tax=Tardiphaga alba TaxID=340268 RepID=UPI00201285F9|nr:glycosyltransferase family 39 protein [Tardiphaga alba]
MLLMLTPVYQFYAQRFNANTVLLAIWPLATYCHLRSFESRSIGWSIAAGAVTALTMLGKYYSVFLIAGFALAAFAHPQRATYFKSWAPWVSTISGLVVLGPHLYWLVANDGASFDYALRQQGGFSFNHSIGEASMFLLGIAAALAFPVIVWMLAAGPRLKRFMADFRAMPPGLLLLFWVFVGTLAFPPLTSLALGTNMPSLWAAQGLFLPVVLIVCGASYAIERFYIVNIAITVALIGVISTVVAAPIHAIYRNEVAANERTYYRLAALELTKRWHQETTRTLTQVSGDDGLAFATAFYSPDHPRYSRPFRYQYTWGMPRPTTLERGWAGLCFTRDTVCTDWMGKVAERDRQAIRVDFEVQPRLWGRPGTPTMISALMVPPRIAQLRDPAGSLADTAEDFSSSHRQPVR